MATISPSSAQPTAAHDGSLASDVTRERSETPTRATTLDWGNSAPLALFASAVTTLC
jgi:hypothetical protein